MKSTNQNPTFWKLFLLFLKLSLLSFGGGNAIFPMIKAYCVDKYNWITNEDLDDILVVTNVIPGASSVEAIAYVSFLLLKSKWKAALVTFLSLLPHTILFFVLFYIGNRFIPSQYLRVIYVAVIPVIIVLLSNITIRYIKVEKNGFPVTLHWLIFVITVSFTLFVPVPWSVPIIIISFFVLCLLIWNWFRKKKNKKGNK